MRSFPSTDITRNSGELLDQADKAPIAITRYNRPRYILMSADHYERIKHGDPRTVHSLGDIQPDMRIEMLTAIDRELDSE